MAAALLTGASTCEPCANRGAAQSSVNVDIKTKRIRPPALCLNLTTDEKKCIKHAGASCIGGSQSITQIVAGGKRGLKLALLKFIGLDQQANKLTTPLRNDPIGGDQPQGHLSSEIVVRERGLDRKSTRLNSSHSQIS